MVRGSRTTPTTPKEVEVTFVLVKLLKLVWLKTLNISPRNCNLTGSLKRIFLNSEKSTRFVGGPLMPPRGALPGVLTRPKLAVRAGFNWKQDVLKYCCRVCGALAFGSQSMLGLLPAINAGLLPRPAASKPVVVAVKGRPVWKVARPETCHPTRNHSSAPF